jgi:hypothetical protein
MRFCPRSQPFGRDGLERGGAKVVKREREEDLSPPLFIYPVFSFISQFRILKRDASRFRQG